MILLHCAKFDQRFHHLYILNVVPIIIILSNLIGGQADQVEGKGGGSLPVSKIVSVRQGQDKCRLECPVLPRFPNGDKNLTAAVQAVIWVLHDANVVISSEGNGIPDKYTFQPVSGELEISHVSYNDAGIYRCIVQCIAEPRKENAKEDKLIGNWSKHGEELRRYRYHTAAVQLLVNQAYENLWEEEYKDNIIRAVLVAAVALLLFALFSFVYTFRWREPKAFKLDENMSFESENELGRERRSCWHRTKQGRGSRGGQEEDVDENDERLARGMENITYLPGEAFCHGNPTPTGSTSVFVIPEACSYNEYESRITSARMPSAEAMFHVGRKDQEYYSSSPTSNTIMMTRVHNNSAENEEEGGSEDVKGVDIRGLGLSENDNASPFNRCFGRERDVNGKQQWGKKMSKSVVMVNQDYGGMEEDVGKEGSIQVPIATPESSIITVESENGPTTIIQLRSK